MYYVAYFYMSFMRFFESEFQGTSCDTRLSLIEPENITRLDNQHL